VSPATLPLSVNVPWQITYNYTLKGNSSECPLPKAQATLKDGTNFVLPTGHHVVSYSAPSGQGVIRFNSAPSNPAKYNVSLIFLDPGVKKPVPFNLGIHEWKHNGTKLTRLELHQDGFSLVAPNNSTKIMTLVPSSPLNIKVYMSGQKPLNDILHVYYDAAGRNIKLFQEPLQNRTVVSFTIGKEKLSGLPVGRGGIRAYLSGMAEPVPTLRYQPNPTLIAAMTAMLREETFYVKWRAEAGENIRLCENGDNLEKGGFITIPPPKPDATGRLLMPEVLECNFIVGRVRDGVFIPVKEPTKVLIKENVEDLLYVDEEGNPEKPVVAIPRAYYTNKDEEFRIAELRTDAQGKLNNVKLSSFAHYRRDSELWDASEGNYYIAPKSGRIYFDGFKLFPSAKNDTGQEVNYLTVPQWILEPSRDFAPIQKPNPKWFNESLRYYLNGIKSLKTKEPGSYLVLTFEQVYFLGSDNSINRYFIRPRPVFNKASKKQIFGFHSYEKKVIDINVFSELVRLDLPHVEKDYYGEDFDYDNMFFATLLHETRHAFQANMRHVKFLPVPGGQLKSVDADGDYLFDPHYIKQQNWSIAKNGFGYLIDDNHSELPDYKNQLFEVNFTDDNGEDKKFKGFSGDRVDDRDKTAYPKQWNAAKELDARYFSQRYNKTLFGR
jgi:hypothetical protein